MSLSTLAPDFATFDVVRNRSAAPGVGSAYQRPEVTVSDQIGERDNVRVVFDEFARARMPELLRFGHALTGSPHAAADLVQDALERTMMAWPRVEKQGDPEGYVRRIMVNRNISIWRRLKREQLVDELPESPTAGREPVVRDLALWERIKTLPPRQRTVIVLRYYEDMSEAQIAAIMGSSVGTVKSQASRALASLRRDSHQFAESDGRHPETSPEVGR